MRREFTDDQAIRSRIRLEEDPVRVDATLDPRHPPLRAGGGADGFTLVEVLVALAILSIAIAAIFDLFKVGLFSAEASAGYSRAIFHGHAKMGELLSQYPVETGGQSGSFEDGYSYETQVIEHEVVGALGAAGEGFEAAAPTAQVYLLEVVIGIPNQKRKLRLQTLRTVPYEDGF